MLLRLEWSDYGIGRSIWYAVRDVFVATIGLVIVYILKRCTKVSKIVFE